MTDECQELSPGAHLRAEMERLGLDQAALAEATGVSRQTVNNIVNNRQAISRPMAAKLGRLTGQSSDYWLRSAFIGRKASQPWRDADEPPGSDHRLHPFAILVNHQIVRAVRDSVIRVDPFRSENVQPASLDLTLDNLIITTEGRQIDISDGQRFSLEGRQTVNVRTREWLEFPFDHVGRLGAITRLAKFGIITSPGHQVAPGFKGQLQFCLFNAGGRRFDLRSGDRIIGLEIMPLSCIPAIGEGVPDGRDPSDRRDVISHFRSNDCNHLIRDFLRTHVTLKPLQSSDKAIGAEIAELGIDIVESSEEAALASAVGSALNTLVIIRTNANFRTDLSDKYCAFFDRIADGLWLSADQVRSAISTLGLTDSTAEQSLVKLRDGSRTIVQSPPGSARITLKNLARQIREDPGDLLLMLTGLRNYK